MTTKFCRICYNEELDDDVLISPCECKGTLSCVHNKCLIGWINQRASSYDLRYSCELCDQRYNIFPQEKTNESSQFTPCTYYDYANLLVLICTLIALFLICRWIEAMLFAKYDKPIDELIIEIVDKLFMYLLEDLDFMINYTGYKNYKTIYL